MTESFSALLIHQKTDGNYFSKACDIKSNVGLPTAGGNYLESFVPFLDSGFVVSRMSFEKVHVFL